MVNQEGGDKTMEENQEALNVEGEENIQELSPEPEQTAEETVEVESTEETEPVETEEEPRKGAQARIRELNHRAKLAEEKALSLENKIAELTNPVGFQGIPTPQYNPQEPIVQDGEEITVAELNRRIAERDQRLLGQATANAELITRQNEAVTRINRESSEAVRKYPELDPDSESFDPELSESISEATQAYVGKNPYSASVTKFVDKLMKPYKGAIDREVGKASEQIAKQTSRAALRPTSIRKTEKSASEKSIAELERDLGVVQS